MKFRKKPVIIEAHQWFKNGDHPLDDSFREGMEYEGKIVRYYRYPTLDGQQKCRICDSIMHIHGFIDTLEGGHIVCPGDWIIQGVKGELYPCKPDIFEATYEKVEEESLPKRRVPVNYLT
jgi:hypothetical protein